MTNKPLFNAGDDWTFELMEKTYAEIEKIAREEMRLDVYPNQIEVITAEQMLDAYSAVGMPINYHHWSFGKDFTQNWDNYQTGNMGLAYEIVINSSPCVSYCMEENDMMMQALVMAHAAFGHNAVFRNNYLFKEWTHADSIVDYMRFARDYIMQCEERYGVDEVESLIDSCHALMDQGVDIYHRQHKKKLSAEEMMMEAKLKYDDELREYNDLYRKTIPKKKEKSGQKKTGTVEPHENILYFIEKNAPSLKGWQREIIRIIRKIAQYFYPQAQTKTLNEGFASFTHYYIMTRLMEKGLITDGTYQSFLSSHTNVVIQMPYHSKYYSGMNPYALGFAIFSDIKRVCDNPTDEDREWFKSAEWFNTYAGKADGWVDAVKYAMTDFKDDSFIMQFLSPKVIRDFKFFEITIDMEENGRSEENDTPAYVSDIHDSTGYINVRNTLAATMERINWVPRVQVISADMDDDRLLTLEYVPYQERLLQEQQAIKVMEHIGNLWNYDVRLIERDPDTPTEFIDLAYFSVDGDFDDDASQYSGYN